MPTLTVPARPEQDASLQPVPWRRMAWVTWRQHRAALTGVAALLGGLAAYLWLAGQADPVGRSGRGRRRRVQPGVFLVLPAIHRRRPNRPARRHRLRPARDQ